MKSSTWGSSFPNPKSQLVQCPNREAMGNSPFFLATATSKRLLCRLCYCFLWPMRKHLTGSSYITGTPSPHLHLVQTPPNVIMCVWAAPISISTTLKKRCKFQSLVLSCTIHVGMLELIQWKPLIPSPVGPKNFARLLGWPYYRGRVKCTIHCIRTCWTAVLFNEQLEYRYCLQ